MHIPGDARGVVRPAVDVQLRDVRLGGSVRIDETYVRIRGEWRYLYRAIDKHGEVVDFLRKFATGPAKMLQSGLHSGFLGKQSVDLSLREPGLAEYLTRVLADQRRSGADGRRGFAHLHGRSDDLDVPGRRVLVAADRVHVLHLRIDLGLQMRFHLAAPDVDGEHGVHQVGGRPALRQRRDPGPDFVALVEEVIRVVVGKKALVAKHATSFL